MADFCVRIGFVAVLCTAAGSVIRSFRPEFSPFFRVAVTIFVAISVLGVAAPLLTYLTSLMEGTALGEQGSRVVKAMGVAALTQLCADICRDCGESSAATGVEMMGRLEILLLCLPLLEQILQTVREVLTWG
mgnify:FL=1